MCFLLDIKPNCIEWNFFPFESVNNFIDFGKILVPVPTLMKSKNSVVKHCRFTDNFSVLLHDIKGGWTSKEEQVYWTTKCFKLDSRGFNNYIHPE